MRVANRPVNWFMKWFAIMLKASIRGSAKVSRLAADVIVAGAGPAGSTAARVAAASGLSTLVIERRAHVGVPVQCGEFLPTPKEMEDLFPKCPRGSRLANVPTRFVTNRCSRVRLISPRCSQFEFNLSANVIDRAQYDSWLASEAERHGADLRLSSTVLGMKGPDEVVFSDREGTHSAKAQVIVGADGPHSRIASSLGRRYMTHLEDLSLSIQYVMTNVDLDPDEIEMYFGDRIAPGGYAWIIPKGESIANVGLGIRSQFASDRTRLKTYLDRFVQRHPVAKTRTGRAKVASSVAALIPVGGPVTKTWSENVMLAGDAAGHVMACNGGGIPTALIDGEIAGQAAAKNIFEGLPLSWYEDTWRKETGTELETALMILHLADQILPSDVLTDACMRLAGSRYLEPLIRCRLPLPVGIAANTLVRLLKPIL